MLRVLGSPQALCDGLTRRDLLRVGGLGLAGLGLADLLRLQDANAATAAAQPRSFGRAKSVILIHLSGGPSHLDTFDPKPILAEYEGRRLPVLEQNTTQLLGKPRPSWMDTGVSYANKGTRDVSPLFKKAVNPPAASGEKKGGGN